MLLKIKRVSIFTLVVIGICSCSSPQATKPAAAPSASVAGPLQIASNSTVRVVGDAKECGRRESGSGFVIAPELIATNAHVVAGVDSPMVDGPVTTKALTGTVVYFDEKLDTALVKVPGLNLPALNIGEQLSPAATGKIIGYPEGNSQVTVDSSITRIFKATTTDIYNKVNVTRDLYEVAAAINHGNSGGPLVDDQGIVHGMVFAKAPSKDATAYVLLPDALKDLATKGASTTNALATKCIAN